VLDYLSELCTPVAQVAERQQLHSASRRLLVMPRIQLDTYRRRAFAVVGPTIWKALTNDLRDPDLNIASFGHPLKTNLFQRRGSVVRTSVSGWRSCTDLCLICG